MNSTAILSDNDRFHCFKADYAERAIANALQKGQITPDDSNLISAFISERRITNAISLRRAQKITSNLITLRRFIKPYRENTIPGIYRGIEKLNGSLSSRGNPFSRNSRVDIIHLCKQFFLWLIENEEVTLSENKSGLSNSQGRSAPRPLPISSPAMRSRHSSLLVCPPGIGP